MACGEKDLSKGNVIFECDDKYPLCVENVINVFNVINKSSKHGLNVDLKTIINKMSHYYNINEQETRRCIASLYLDGAINIRIEDKIIYFSSNIRGRRYYPSVLKEKIRQNILRNICKMYVKMNLIIDNIVSEFSMDNLMNYLIKENVKIPRIRLTTNLLLNCLEKLCHNGFLKKNDFSMFTITIKSIKFGQKFEEFKNYCKNVNVQTIYRQRKSISNNFIQSEKCNILPIFWNNNNNNNDVPRNLNIQFGTNSSNILTNFNKFNTVNMIKNQISPGFYINEALPMSMGNISFISQGFTCCNFCGQSLNENGNILQCNGCNINAHVPCKSFFNCSRSLKWCSSCLYPFQVSTENGEFVDLLCQDCFNQRMCDMCPSCQEIMDGTNVEIVQLESFEMKEDSDNAFPNRSHLISVEENTFEAYGHNSQSFVEMLNESEESSTLEIEKVIPVKSWTSKDVETWLTKEGYPRMCTKFKNEEIDGKSLLLLVEEDLRLMNLNENIVSELYKIITKLK